MTWWRPKSASAIILNKIKVFSLNITIFFEGKRENNSNKRRSFASSFVFPSFRFSLHFVSLKSTGMISIGKSAWIVKKISSVLPAFYFLNHATFHSCVSLLGKNNACIVMVERQLTPFFSERRYVYKIPRCPNSFQRFRRCQSPAASHFYEHALFYYLVLGNQLYLFSTASTFAPLAPPKADLVCHGQSTNGLSTPAQPAAGHTTCA